MVRKIFSVTYLSNFYSIDYAFYLDNLSEPKVEQDLLKNVQDEKSPEFLEVIQRRTPNEPMENQEIGQLDEKNTDSSNQKTSPAKFERRMAPMRKNDESANSTSKKKKKKTK